MTVSEKVKELREFLERVYNSELGGYKSGSSRRGSASLTDDEEILDPGEEPA